LWGFKTPARREIAELAGASVPQSKKGRLLEREGKESLTKG
tara:strand:- start:430 stop:552 length:123 start_codon:yes stop_codon:yes gene_type:complete